MVHEVLILPKSVVESIDTKNDNVLLQALKREYSGDELAAFTEAGLAGDHADPQVLAALEPVEREAVVERAEDAGVPPGELLRRLVLETVDDPDAAGYTSIEEQVEWAIMRHM